MSNICHVDPPNLFFSTVQCVQSLIYYTTTTTAFPLVCPQHESRANQSSCMHAPRSALGRRQAREVVMSFSHELPMVKGISFVLEALETFISIVLRFESISGPTCMYNKTVGSRA